MDDAIDKFDALLADSLAQGSFVGAVWSKPTPGDADLRRVSARTIRLRDADCLSLVYSHATRDITKNFALPEGVTLLRDLLRGTFKHAHLHTTSDEVQLRIGKRGRATLHARAIQRDVPEPAHDREKQRWIDVRRPFLSALGVTTPQGQLVPAMARKWKQINKFVEILAGAIAASPLAQATPLRVADFGSGKGYLTFAVHDHLCHTRAIEAQVTGVELRPDMVRLCSDAAHKLSLQGLQFVEGDVRSHTFEALDVMIALHACDVATDHAIHAGVRAGASIIVCSPCCHKEIRPQLLSPHPLQPILQHGVHLGQEAEMVTDGLRALLLQACGYETQVFEFVSLEHTQKNKMILAVRRGHAPHGAAALAQVQEVKAFYGIKTQCLESLLRAEGRLLA